MPHVQTFTVRTVSTRTLPQYEAKLGQLQGHIIQSIEQTNECIASASTASPPSASQIVLIHARLKPVEQAVEVTVKTNVSAQVLSDAVQRIQSLL